MPSLVGSEMCIRDSCGMRVAGIFLSSIRGSYASDLADCLAAELLDKRVRIVAIVTEQRLAWKDFLEYVRLYHLDTAIVHYLSLIHI